MLETAEEDLRLAMAVLTRRLRAESNKHELSWSQLAVTARLEMAGPSTTAELARAEAVKTQAIGANLGALEEDGVGVRSADDTDGHRGNFTFTQEGPKT